MLVFHPPRANLQSHTRQTNVVDGLLQRNHMKLVRQKHVASSQPICLQNVRKSGYARHPRTKIASDVSRHVLFYVSNVSVFYYNRKRSRDTVIRSNHAYHIHKRLCIRFHHVCDFDVQPKRWNRPAPPLLFTSTRQYAPSSHHS